MYIDKKMLPKVWGKYGWDFIHLVTLGYPECPSEIDKKNYNNFFNILRGVLPCDKCRYNLTHHLKKYPLNEQVLSSRTTLVKWGIDLHNVVNYYTGKPMLTYAEAINEINKLVNPEKNKWGNPIYYLLLVIVLMMVCYMFYYYLAKN